MTDDPIYDTISYRIAQVGMRHRNLALRLLSELGIHPGQEFLLNLLWRDDGRTQTELATECGVEAPTISRGVQRLERAGLVTRRPDADDGRVQRVWLTNRGQRLRPEVAVAWERLEARTLDGLDAGQRAQLRLLLDLVRTNLTPGPGGCAGAATSRDAAPAHHDVPGPYGDAPPLTA